MSKTFTYTKITSSYYLDYTDEWEEDGVDFEYEVEDYRLAEALADILVENYYGEDKQEIKKFLKDVIYDNDLVEKLADKYETALENIFKDEAFEYYGG